MPVRCRTVLAALTSVSLAATPLVAAPRNAAPRYDFLIRNAKICDGNGGAPYLGDVGVARQRI